MKIQYLSDLHLELQDNSRYFKSVPFEAVGDVLVAAGDIAYLPTLPLTSFWKKAAKSFKKVLLVPGNHEFYNFGDVGGRGGSWEEEILPGVSYYQNKVVEVDGVDFILSTMWSHVPPHDEYQVSRGMNDFRRIKYGGRGFTVEDFNAEHEKAVEFIKKSVEESRAEKIVVVTHHLPTYAVADPRYRGDRLNSAFAAELGEYIAGSRINLWIYGHSHANIDYEIGGTKIVSNQLGYVYYGENKDFDPNKVIEI